MKNGNSSRDGYEVYERIFGDVSSVEDLRRAIALATRELRASMEKEDNPAATRAHMRNLDDVAPEALARAYALAERICIYWPTPGQIRDFAGCSESQRAQDALGWVLQYLTEHGAEGRSKGGGASYGDDGTGRRATLITQPTVEAPQLPDLVERALIILGGGSRAHGFRYLGQHPRVSGWDDAGGEPPARAAERVERQWARCYTQSLREQTPSLSTLGRTH